MYVAFIGVKINMFDRILSFVCSSRRNKICTVDDCFKILPSVSVNTTGCH